ncbi:MAG: HD domain-containing protein [Methylocella sp.]
MYPHPRELAGVAVPDSSLAKAATTLAAEASPTFLFNHCLRTFALGAKAGAKLGLTYDPELFYVAALLHDLGLTPKFEAAERFEVDGADAARAFCLEHGIPPERAERVWDAIALHTTVGIAPRNGPEATLVQLGAGTDVFGFGLDVIGREDVDWVMREAPRDGFSLRFLELIVDLGRRNPAPHAWTFVSEIGHQFGHDHPCPTHKQVLPQWNAIVEPESSH